MKCELEELLLEVKSSQERSIIEVLLNNFECIPQMKLEHIAELSYCSKTSVRRVIIKLGYKGYIEYQLHVKMSQAAKKHAYSDSMMFPKKSISECESFINFINSSEQIFVYGYGSNALAAQYLFRQLLENGKVVTWINEQDLLHSLHDETIIIVSNTGRSANILNLASELMERHSCSVAAITKEHSELAKLVNVNLVHNNESSININDPMDSFILINQVSKMI